MALGSGRTFLYFGLGNSFLSQTPEGQVYLNKSIAFSAALSLPIITKRTFSMRIETRLDYSYNTQNNLPAMPKAFHVIGETSSIIASI